MKKYKYNGNIAVTICGIGEVKPEQEILVNESEINIIESTKMFVEIKPNKSNKIKRIKKK